MSALPAGLRATIAVFLLSGTGRAQAAGVPFVLDVQVVGRATLEQGQPETALRFDADRDPAGLWLTEDLLQPRSRTGQWGAFLLAGGEIEITPWLSLRALADSGELQTGGQADPPVDGVVASDGRPLSEAARSTAFVRELEATLQLDRVSIGIGRRRHALAQGLVYDDYSTGVFAGIDLAGLTPWTAAVHLSASLLGPILEIDGDANPWLTAELSLQPSLFEDVSVFIARLEDRQGVLRDPLRSGMAERIMIQTRDAPLMQQQRLSELFAAQFADTGHVHYVGATCDLLPWPGLRLRAAAVYGSGRLAVRRDTADEPLELDLSSFGASAQATVGLSEDAGVGAFVFGLSGDDAPQIDASEAGYGAFVGVAPYWTWTGLFFSGGLTQSFYAGRSTAAGVNGHGVAGAGLSFERWSPRGLVKVVAASMHATEPPPPPPLGGGGLHYGVELDVYGEWALGEVNGIGVEFDVLRPGTFFPSQRVAWRLIAMWLMSWSVHDAG